MSKEKQQSAIDSIHQILNEMKEMREEIKVLDINVKLLNNKINKLLPQSVNGVIPKKPNVFKQGISNSNNEENDSLTKLFSRIKSANKKPIKDVYVTIFNAKGEFVKKRTTDADGYWEARVPPGAYVIEINAKHINKKFNPININVEIDETMNEYEVRNTG